MHMNVKHYAPSHPTFSTDMRGSVFNPKEEEHLPKRIDREEKNNIYKWASKQNKKHAFMLQNLRGS